MKIVKLVLKNVFSYYGTNEILFEDNNYIIGKNGMGKTSILNSIKVLLGVVKLENSTILNNLADDNYEISLYLEEFSIHKIYENGNDKFFVKFKDYVLNENESMDFINEKFPLFLLDFIFYDGEIDSNILMMKNSKIKKLFNYIFDLDILEFIHLDSKKASKELVFNKKESGENRKYEILKTKIDENETLINKLNIIKDELNIEIKVLSKEILKIDKKMKLSSDKIETLTSKLNSLNVEKEFFVDTFKEINLFSLPILLNPNIQKNLKQTEVLEIKNINEFQKRLKQLNDLIGRDISNEFKSLFLDEVKFDLKYNREDFKNLLLNMKNINIEIEKVENQIKEIEISLNDEYQQLKETLIEKNSKKDSLEKEILNIVDKIEILITENKSLEKELTQIYKNQKNSFAILKSFESLNQIAEFSKEIYSNILKDKLLEFNNSLKDVTKIFKNIHNSIERIYLDENFNLNLIDNMNKKLNKEFLSAGQKQVLNFLIIKNILEFNKFSDFLFVDTPFGRLSDSNRVLILNECYLKFNQLVLLITDNEYNFLESQNLKADKIYNIKKEKNYSRIID